MGRLKYLLQRKSKYKIHSPFVYDFMTKVLYDKGSNRDYDTMLRISRLLDGKKYPSRSRRKEARLLYRLVDYLEPETVVLFGTLSALNTTALALGNLQTKVYLDHSADFLETMNSMGVVNVNLLRRDKPEQEQLQRLSLDFVFFGLNDFGEDMEQVGGGFGPGQRGDRAHLRRHPPFEPHRGRLGSHHCRRGSHAEYRCIYPWHRFLP